MSSQQAEPVPVKISSDAPQQQGQQQSAELEASSPTGFASSAVISVTEQHYQPQERILNMTMEEQEVFKAQYVITQFDGRAVRDTLLPVLSTLEKLDGVRVTYFPVSKETLGGTSGEATTTRIEQVAPEKENEKDEWLQQHPQTSPPQQTLSGSGGATKDVPQQQQQQQEVSTLSSQRKQSKNQPQSGGSGAGGSAGSGAGAGKTVPLISPPILRTAKNFLITPTSAVTTLSISSTTVNWETGTAAQIKFEDLKEGDLLFANISQLPSKDNRDNLNSPIKPCMHLFIFSKEDSKPVLVVERYLREKSRMLRVFNGNLDHFGSIECRPGFGGLTPVTHIIGADLESTLFTIKPAKTFGFGPSNDYVIKQRKKKVGMITSKFATTNRTSADRDDSVPYDLFFPKDDTKWSHRAMLIVTTLYMDYLFGD